MISHRAIFVFLGAMAFVVLAAALFPPQRGARDSARQPAPASGPIEASLPEDASGPCQLGRVIDGDTVDIACGSDQSRIRLLQIDTPERGESGFAAASAALASLLEDQEIYLVFERPRVRELGGFGRLLAYLYVGGINVNVAMVRRGWSPHWIKYGAGRFPAAFEDAEQAARREGRGLWSRSSEP